MFGRLRSGNDLAILRPLRCDSGRFLPGGRVAVGGLRQGFLAGGGGVATLDDSPGVRHSVPASPP